jgi:hypothetical protein
MIAAIFIIYRTLALSRKMRNYCIVNFLWTQRLYSSSKYLNNSTVITNNRIPVDPPRTPANATFSIILESSKNSKCGR